MNSMATYSSIVGFLETNNLGKTAKALKDDLSQDLSHMKADPQIAQELFKLMKKVVTVKDNREIKPKGKEISGPEKRRPGASTLTPEETENVMAGFLNKLMNKPLQLSTEKLNPKMEKLLGSPKFKKMSEKSEALNDVSNMSVMPTQGRENPNERRREEKKSGTEASWDQRGQNAQNTSKPDLSDMLTEQEIPQKDKNQKGKAMIPEVKIEQKKPVTKTPINAEKDRSRRNPGESFGEDRSVFDVMDQHTGTIPSIIHPVGGDDSITHSFVIPGLEDPFANAVDDYVDDDDPGFDLYEVAERDFVSVAKQLADKYGFPARSCAPGPNKEDDNKDKDTERNRNQFTPTDDSGLILQELKNKKDGKGEETTPKNSSMSERTDKDKKPKGYIHLPSHLKHPTSNDSFYPVVFENVIYDCFNMKVIYDRERTGFEETKDFPIVINSIVGGRYQILQYLGSAAFSKAIECLDMVTQQRVCMKVIENNKDYFDQSVDEIKLLKFINHNADVDEKCVLKFYDFFYHKEHLFIVTELLKENLYEYQKLNKERDQEQYFTIGRLQKITRQILVALDYIHGLNLIHCDLKPENILLKDYENADIKVIDFGSSCFIHDHLSSYVQSRSYRAPEVIIGCKYDYKVDMWSLGCILAELWTGNVLFQNDTVQGLLARVIGIIGAFPEHMTKSGRLTHNFFTKEKLLYQEAVEEGESHAMTENSEMMGKKRGKTGRVQILVPKRSSLKHRLRTNDLYFLDFVRGLLEIDPAKRPSAREAMNHPWITDCRYNDLPFNPKKI